MFGWGSSEVFFRKATSLVGVARVRATWVGAICLAHHVLQHALLLGVQRGQVYVARGPKFAAVVQVLILQPDIVPDEATTLDGGKRRGEARRGEALLTLAKHLWRVWDGDSPRDLEYARAGLDIVGRDQFVIEDN